MLVCRLILFQSTLPRGSDIPESPVAPINVVSIHAPARERLYNFGFVVIERYVSIHAPARSDVPGLYFLEPVSRFNPRSRAGATPDKYGRLGSMEFQSTLPREERPDISSHTNSKSRFNPRSRAGATNYGLVESRNHLGFNPRSRAGSDMMSCPDLPKSCVFQSTLPREERRLTHNLLNINNFFAILCVSIIFHLKNLRLSKDILLTSLFKTSFKHCEPYMKIM